MSDQPEKPGETEAEKEIIRIENPAPGLGALLMRGDTVLAEHHIDQGALRPSGVKQLSAWVESQASADKLVVEVDSDHITDDEVRQLARVGSRHQLAIDVKLK